MEELFPIAQKQISLFMDAPILLCFIINIKSSNLSNYLLYVRDKCEFEI